jgi:hypothetical protein
MTDRRSHPVLAAAVTGTSALSVALIGYALMRTPAALPAVAGSAALTLAVLAGCAVFPWFGPLSTRDSGRRVAQVGGVVGLVLGSALVAVDLTTPSVGIPVEFVILGTMALAYAVASAITGIRAAVWTAVVGYLVWYPTIWLYYLVGYGSATYDRALRAEGEYEDFHRSGLTDFTTFLLRDFLGAGFLHLLLGVLLALGAGSGVAAVVALTRRVLRTVATRPSRRRMLTVALVGTTVFAATAASSVPAIAAPAHHRHPHPAVSVIATTITLTASRSQPPVVTACQGAPGIVEVRTSLTGQASSPDPRLTGTLTVSARVLVSAVAGNGFTTGTIVIRDPTTGRIKVRAQLTQLETAGATKFDGLLDGTVEPSGSHLVALYSGRIDTQTGTLNANVGTDTPVPPRHTAVVVTGDC